jgi:hypothetical protein
MEGERAADYSATGRLPPQDVARPRTACGIGYGAPNGGGVTAGADELVDLTYFIARRPSVELHNASCAAISGFHQHAATEMVSKVTSSRAHT